jgi:hypothetical protein
MKSLNSAKVFCAAVAALFIMRGLAHGQWDNNGAHIFNTNAGNVGIGTMNPGAKLHVNGSVRGNQTGGALRISTDFGYVNLGPTNASWAHFTTDRNKFYFNKEIRVNSGQIGSYDENLQLRTEGTTRVTILNSNGNVGIGTTNPQTELAVNGTITAQEVQVTLQGWADFVFDENYALMSLYELEESIKENKHLPDIPSADEVAKNGVSLGEMQAKLLQKIEELTLYVIDLKKENENLKMRVSALEQ